MLLEKDQEISSLQHKLSVAEGDIEKAEGKVKDLKAAADEGDTHKTTGEHRGPTLNSYRLSRGLCGVVVDAVLTLHQGRTWREKSSFWRKS